VEALKFNVSIFFEFFSGAAPIEIGMQSVPEKYFSTIVMVSENTPILSSLNLAIF